MYTAHHAGAHASHSETYSCRKSRFTFKIRRDRSKIDLRCSRGEVSGLALCRKLFGMSPKIPLVILAGQRFSQLYRRNRKPVCTAIFFHDRERIFTVDKTGYETVIRKKNSPKYTDLTS